MEQFEELIDKLVVVGGAIKFYIGLHHDLWELLLDFRLALPYGYRNIHMESNSKMVIVNFHPPITVIRVYYKLCFWSFNFFEN